MELLADENIETEWIQALRDDGHDIVRVVDSDTLGVSATDPDVLANATRDGRVLLTADQSDFSDPPADDHPGILIIADVTRTGGEVRRAVRRIERSVPARPLRSRRVRQRLAVGPDGGLGTRRLLRPARGAFGAGRGPSPRAEG